MAQLQKGTTYQTGDSVTADNLNAHVDSAILLDGAITDQNAAGAPSASDKLLISQSNALKQISVQELFASPQPIGATTPNAATVTTASVTGTLSVTGITTLTDNVVANKSLIVNETGVDVDSRIEGDNDANLVYVDAGNDRVGIGTATPTTKLEVSGTAKITGDTSIDAAVVINDSGADKDTRVEGMSDQNLIFVDASQDSVGIGTAPASGKKLDVNGNVKVTGDIAQTGNLSVSGAITNAGVVKAFCKFTTSSHVATLDANIKSNVASVAATGNATEYKITFTTAAPTAYLIAIGQAARSNNDIWSIETVSATTADITFTLKNRDGTSTDGQDGSVWIAVLGV